MSIDLLEMLADLIGICPIQEDFHVDELVSLEVIDCIGNDTSKNIHLTFDWGGYSISLKSCGEMEIWADERTYEQDKDSLIPDSMRSDSQVNTPDLPSPRRN
jgi:hypothetical protein